MLAEIGSYVTADFIFTKDAENELFRWECFEPKVEYVIAVPKRHNISLWVVLSLSAILID